MERILCLHKELQVRLWVTEGQQEFTNVHTTVIPHIKEADAFAQQCHRITKWHPWLCRQPTCARQHKKESGNCNLQPWQAIDKPLTSHWQACHSMSCITAIAPWTCSCTPPESKHVATFSAALVLRKISFEAFQTCGVSIFNSHNSPFPSFFVEWTQQIPTSQ